MPRSNLGFSGVAAAAALGSAMMAALFNRAAPEGRRRWRFWLLVFHKPNQAFVGAKRLADGDGVFNQFGDGGIPVAALAIIKTPLRPTNK